MKEWRCGLPLPGQSVIICAWRVEMDKKYYTYLVRCSDGSYYCGYTVNPEARTRVHNQGKGAKYTRSRRPVTLVYTECFDTKNAAMSRECQMKKLTHKAKEVLAERYQQRKEEQI